MHGRDPGHAFLLSHDPGCIGGHVAHEQVGSFGRGQGVFVRLAQAHQLHLHSAYDPPARMRQPSHDNGISHPRAIRSHGPEANAQSLDFPPIAFPRRQDRLVAPRLQTQRESHVWVQVAERTPRRDENSPAGVICAAIRVTCRKRKVGRQTKLDTWSHSLAVGQPLPSLPVWLSETQTVALDLESSYEETCRVLRIS